MAEGPDRTLCSGRASTGDGHRSVRRLPHLRGPVACCSVAHFSAVRAAHLRARRATKQGGAAHPRSGQHPQLTQPIRSKTLKIGMYKATIIDPTTTPKNTIINNS